MSRDECLEVGPVTVQSSNVVSKETKLGKDFGVESAHLAAPPVKVAIIASDCFTVHVSVPPFIRAVFAFVAAAAP